MAGLLFDTDTPQILLEPLFYGCRVATYADLVTPTLLAQLAGRLIVIDRGLGDPHNVATVADIEDGALSVASGAEKIKGWHAEGRPFPTAYHDRALQAAVDQALAGTPCNNWVATLDGTLLPDGVRRAVVQFAGAAAIGVHADLSIVWDDGWHPMPAYPPAATVAALRRYAADANVAIGSLISLAAHL